MSFKSKESEQTLWLVGRMRRTHYAFQDERFRLITYGLIQRRSRRKRLLSAGDYFACRLETAEAWPARSTMTPDDLHLRIAAGDSSAVDLLVVILLPVLRAHLRVAIPRADPHDVDAAILDSIMTYLGAPMRFNPAKGVLVAWMRRIAINRLRDVRRAERVRLTRESPVGLCFDTEAPSSLHTDRDHPSEIWIRAHRRELLSVARTPEERRFIEARLDGRSTVEQLKALAGVAKNELGPEALGRTWDLLRRRLRWRLHRRR
jgi:DNA-directed RNA polymerase specialized sigma24 family protein